MTGRPPLRRPVPAPPRGAVPAAAPAAVQPLDADEIDRLAALLDAVPAPLEPLDLAMLDGYLCGVLVQPQRVPESRWWPYVLDAEAGRAPPAGWSAAPLRALVRRRHAELDAAIEARRWFDPWVEAIDDEVLAQAQEAGVLDAGADEVDAAPPEVQAVYPWVAGCVTALDRFPGVMDREGPALDEALVLLYRHLDPDDLEDADDILAAIDLLEPPQDLATAVEELVRATLLLADIGRPRAPRPQRAGPRRQGRPGPRTSR